MLQHVSLEVPPEQAERFAELLGAIGFAPVPAPAALGEAVRWFADGSGASQVHLILTEGATAPALGHAAFVVDGFAAAITALRQRGFEVTPARELWGEARAFVLAPGGHRLELMAAPPG